MKFYPFEGDMNPKDGVVLHDLSTPDKEDVRAIFFFEDRTYLAIPFSSIASKGAVFAGFLRRMSQSKGRLLPLAYKEKLISLKQEKAND